MPRTPLRLTALACCLASAFAHAQEAPTLETVQVTGQSASLDNALDVQQAADHIVSAVMADDIGKLPDDNAAEALQRVPGVSIERDQGEGRYVRIRGLGPDYNTVTINGAQTPSPDSDRRAVALDVVPASLVRSIELQKTLTPDKDANSLGGTVEIKTLTGFDHPGKFMSLDMEAGHDSNAGKTSPKISGAYSNRLGPDGKLGIALGLSYEGRRFGSDNVETGGAWDFGKSGGSDGAARLGESEMRRYDIKRERIGGVFNLDYRPDTETQYFLHTLASRFSDTETRQAFGAEFADAQLAGERGDAETWRALKSRKETQSIFSAVLGTEQRLGDWKLGAALAGSRAGEKSPLGIASAKFTGNDAFSGVGFDDSRRPVLSGPSAMYDPGAYSLDKVERERSDTRDTINSIKLDLSRDFKFDKNTLELKFGGKMASRKKTNDLEAWTYKKLDKAGVSDDQLSLAALSGGNVSHGLGSFGPGVSTGRLNGLLDGLNADDYYDEEASRVADFHMREKINAAYVQGTWASGPLRLLGGLRYEGTRFSAHGSRLDNGEFSATSAENKYHHWLPALHLRYDLSDATTLRAAYTQSVVRPTFGQLAPNYVIDGDEAEFGNPDLKPLTSRNFDLGVEHRFGYASVVSAYVFRKNIKNFVYQTNLAGSGSWADFDQATTYANGDKAHVQGLELAYSQSFRDTLPAPWNGLLVGANATFSRSKARIGGYEDGVAVSRTISLPSQSDTTLNLMLGYESGPWSARVAVSHKSPYLLETGSLSDARHDIHVDSQTQVDFSFGYRLNKNTRVIFQAVNLTNSKYYAYTGGRAYNAQYEKYGPIYKLGLSFAL
ncbi:TonB-dependent receptor [Diaphorobacter caeni]|uniref:TonB-dependent receptor n=1 Tax=Diaphorobacter caeni TaxID=2784387 RepID=UPI00188E82AD|nr:TonB-dependent receptor [Diaphorobacter caeni]MBF5004514.1 TonB-dependent receptor [Diaphorobacter caeni]